jgi:predicted Zn-dependent protease
MCAWPLLSKWVSGDGDAAGEVGSEDMVEGMAGNKGNKSATRQRHHSQHMAMRLFAPGRFIATALAACIGITSLTPPALAQVNLPTLGDTASEDFNIGSERRLGNAIMRDIRRDPDYLDDPILYEYLQSLWQPLVASARLRGDIGDELNQRFAYETFLIRDRNVNAFALPGGFVGVYLGLIAVTQTRDELASVLAHEMTHINQRHIARGFANSQRMTMLGAAAMILGVLAASRSRNGSGDAAGALVTGGQAGAIQGQLNFSRDMEREADRIGTLLMAGAGFQPSGMAAMFERLQGSSRLNDSGGFPYLRSHPLTTERIGEARSRLGTDGIGTPVVRISAPVSALEHTAALARARVLMDTRVDALRRWQALDGDGALATATTADRYADALSSAYASSLLRDWARADASFDRAWALARGEGIGAGAAVAGNEATNQGAAARVDQRADRAVRLMKVESLLARGDPVAAQSVLAPLQQHTGPYAGASADVSRPVMLLAAQVALAPGSGADESRKRSSSDQLQTWVARAPNDALAWSVLGQLSAQLGLTLRGLRAEAESRYAVGDLPGAIDRLRAGQRLARNSSSAVDFVELSVIDSRVRAIEAERKQELLEARNL